jgi:hypothetical protein
LVYLFTDIGHITLDVLGPLRGDPVELKFDISLEGGRRFKGLGRALTLMLSLEPLKTCDDRENADRGRHRVTNLLLGPLAPFSLCNARIDIVTLFPAERWPKVLD